MRRVMTAAIVLAALLPGTAMAGGYGQPKNEGTTIKLTVSQWLDIEQAQQQRQRQNQGQSQSQQIGAGALSPQSSATIEGSGPGGALVPSPASGPCTGFSGGFAFNSIIGGGGLSIGTIEKACRQDEHIRIGLSDPVTAPQARHDWFSMDGDLFGHANMDPTAPPAGTQTSALAPAAPIAAPLQTAEAGPICGDNLPKVLLAQCQAK